MTAYEQLMAKINHVEPAADQSSFIHRMVNKTLEVADQVTSEAYARTVDAIGAQAGAAKANIMATPKLFRDGQKRGENRAAEVLLKLMSK